MIEDLFDAYIHARLLGHSRPASCLLALGLACRVLEFTAYLLKGK